MNASQASLFSCVVPDFVRCKFKGTGVEKKLFRTQSGIQTKFGGV